MKSWRCFQCVLYSNGERHTYLTPCSSHQGKDIKMDSMFSLYLYKGTTDEGSGTGSILPSRSQFVVIFTILTSVSESGPTKSLVWSERPLNSHEG